MTIDKKEAYKILELSEGASQTEIKKARDRLARKWHPDKNSNSKESTEKIQEINKAYEFLSGQKEGGDSSNIDEDAIFLMKQKIKNALDHNNVRKEELEDETIKNYEEKLSKCKTKEDLERFTSEVVFFIQLYARARDKGYFKKEAPKTKPTPETETRSNTNSSTSSPKYSEFTCDWCTLKVKSDDPRPKYTFEGIDKAFCCKECRENWDKDDLWWKDWNEKKKKEEQEWEEYKKKQDQKWADYFKNSASSNNYQNYQPYSSYNYTPSSSDSSSSGSSDIASWLDEYKKTNEKRKSESLEQDKKQYIRDVEFKLSLKLVSEEKLNKKLRVNSWKEKINECSDSMEAWDEKFKMENMIEKLSREYTCANCRTVKDNYYPWEKNGKKYCSLECQNKSDKDNKGQKSLKAISQIKELFAWMRKMGAEEIKFNLNNNQIIIKVSGSEKKIDASRSGLSQKLQQELKSNPETITFSELSDANKKNNRNDKVGIIGAMLIIGIFLAVVIGVVIHKNKKKDY